MKCVEANLKLDEEQHREFERLLLTERYREIGPMMQTTFEKGVAQGVAQGVEKARRQDIQLLLDRRFGPLSAEVVRRLEQWPSDRLADLIQSILDAPSLKALGLED